MRRIQFDIFIEEGGVRSRVLGMLRIIEAHLLPNEFVVGVSGFKDEDKDSDDRSIGRIGGSQGKLT